MIAAPVLGGIITGGSSILSGLLGGILGKSSQSDANAANLQIARETNAANQMMNLHSIMSQEKLFKMAAKYNSMEEQVKRAQQAGFSPSAILETSGYNSSMSTPSLPSMAPNVLSAPMQPENAFASALANIPNQIADSYLKIANALSAHADVPLKGAQTESTKADVPLKGAQTEQARAAAKRERSTSALQDFELMKNEAIFDDVMKQAHLQTIKQSIDVERSKYDAALSKLELEIQQEFAHDNAQEKLNYIREQIRNLNALTDKYVEEGQSQKAIRAELYARVNSLNADSRLKNQLYNYLDEVNPYLIQVAQKEGEEADTTRKWNKVNLRTFLDQGFEKGRFAVEEQKAAIGLLNEQIELAKKEGEYKRAEKLMEVVNRMTKSLKDVNGILSPLQ